MKEVKNLKEDLQLSELVSVYNRWDEESIADGLNPSRLGSILREANRGEMHDYLTLAEEMEERDPHYGSVTRTRKLAIEGLDRHVEAAGEDSKSQEIAEAVRDLVRKPAFDELVGNLADGLGKGFAVCEIDWETGSRFVPAAYNWRDPRNFRFDKKDAHKILLLDKDGQATKALPPYKTIVHIPRLKSGRPVRGGLARMCALSYVCKAFAMTDMMAFCEKFGLPIVLGKYGPNTGDPEKATLRRAVRSIGSEAYGIIPESMMIEFVQVAQAKGGEALFLAVIEFFDKQMSKAVLGQTMTADDGSSQAQAKVHNEVRLDLLKADAKQLSATVNDQLIKPFIDLNWGVQENYPNFEFYVAEPEDLTPMLEAVKSLVPLGLKVPQRFILEKFGIPDAAEDDELLSSQFPSAGGVDAASGRGGQDADTTENPTDTALNAMEIAGQARNDDVDSAQLSAVLPPLDTGHPDHNYTEFVNLSEIRINELVTALEKAESFDEIKALINEAELGSSDIADALAAAGIKRFAEGSES